MAARLHLRCGSDIKDALQIAKIAGDFASFGDPICEGPCPGNLAHDQYLHARAAFMKAHWDIDLEESLGRFARDAQRLATLESYDDIILWFEHDLFDQCILTQVLAGLSEPARRKSSLICIDAFPGIDRFLGLGQLGPDQLRSLLPQAKPVTIEAQHVARRACLAWKSPQAQELLALTQGDNCGPLKFLAPAIRRHLQELPSTANGLGRTAHLILESIQKGASTGIEVFTSYQTEDPAPYLGDLMFWAHLHELAAPPCPLIKLEGFFPVESVQLTATGIAVLEGRSNYVQLNGCPEHSLYRWRGGIEQRPEQGWYTAWDEQRATVVQSAISVTA